MAHEEKMDEIENVEVEALTEGELEEVAGGFCSVSDCSNGSSTALN